MCTICYQKNPNTKHWTEIAFAKLNLSDSGHNEDHIAQTPQGQLSNLGQQIFSIRCRYKEGSRHKSSQGAYQFNSNMYKSNPLF
jgi:hypothetical protein